MIILGGGLAGLAASLSCGAPIYEAADRVGGTSRSDTIDGFTFDYGIHVLQTENAIVHDLFRRVGVGLCTRRRNAHIYSHGCHTAYPFQVSTAGLPIGVRARCVWQFLRRRQHGAPTNYQEWIDQNLGTGFGDTFLVPYSEKFWTVSPREMTYEWTGDRVPSPSTLQVLCGALIKRQTKIGKNAVFQYPESEPGYRAIPDAMGRHVEADIHLNCRATRVDTARRVVEFDGQTEVSYDKLVSTIPLPELVHIIPAAPDAVREAAHKLRHNSIFVVNLGIDKPKISDRHWVHYPEKEISFFRISYPDNLGPNVVPEGMSSVTAEVAYSQNKPIDKSTIVDHVIEDLKRTGAIGKKEPVVLKHTMDIQYGYVIYDRIRKSALRTIHDWLATVDIYPTGRYGLWAYLWSHDAILAGKRTAEKLAYDRQLTCS